MDADAKLRQNTGMTTSLSHDRSAKLGATDARRSLKDLKILHVLDHSVPIHSGYSFRSLAIIREQHKRGWQTAHLTTPKHTEKCELVEVVDGLTFYRTPANGGFIAGLPGVGEIGLIRAAARRIEEVAAVENPDIIHAHSPSLNAVAALMAARRIKTPVVYEVRAFWEDAAVSHGTSSDGGARYRLTRALESFAARRSAAVATICEGLRQDLLARGISQEKIVVIPNGVDIEKFPFRAPPDVALRQSLDLADKIVLGFLGSYYAYEGLDFLISAMPQILAKGHDVVLLLVGGGPEEENLKRQVASLGLETAVRFVGRVPHNEVQRYSSIVDIFVFPRHRMRLTETVTPLKPLESMAVGGIVLASDVGGHRELIRNGETGYLFKADDGAAFVDTLTNLIRTRESWDAIRQSGRLFVERERNWQATTAGHEELYVKALASRQR